MIVEFAVASDFSEKQSHSGNADHGQRGHRIFDFSPYLILQITISNIFLICNKINKNEKKMKPMWGIPVINFDGQNYQSAFQTK